MKYLRKYNESVNNSDIAEYIKLVFADLIVNEDDYEFEEGVSDSRYGTGLPFANCYISIMLPTLHKPNQKMDGYTIGMASGDISEFVTNSEKATSIYKDVEICLNRIKDEYPNVRHKIEKEPDEIYRNKIISGINVHIEWGEHSEI